MRNSSKKKSSKKRTESMTDTIINESKKIISETIDNSKKLLTTAASTLIEKADVIIETGKSVAKFIINSKEKIIDPNLLNKKREPVNIICIKYGDAYGAEYVNKLFNMVLANITIPFRFFCFTEDSTGIDERIIIKDIPLLKDKDGNMLSSFSTYHKEAGLCDDDLGGYELRGKRVLFLDLDVIITDNIDKFFSYNKNPDDFIIIKDWNKGKKSNKYGQASCYSFRVGTLGYIKKYYENNTDLVHKKYKKLAQEFLSNMVISKYGKLNFWPSDWVKGFKKHCLPNVFLRWFKMPKFPNGAKIICFNGYPNPTDALVGRWAPVGQSVPFLKRIYKHVRPTKWIADYWK